MMRNIARQGVETQWMLCGLCAKYCPILLSLYHSGFFSNVCRRLSYTVTLTTNRQGYWLDQHIVRTGSGVG
jgi:hypothetical protein